jgi:hypothetical protein
MGKHMTDVEWQPLPPLWPEPAVWTDVGELMLLVFTQVGVPTWEVSRRAKAGSSRDDLIANGTADTFEAAKAAALFEARARSTEWGTLTQNLSSGKTAPFQSEARRGVRLAGESRSLGSGKLQTGSTFMGTMSVASAAGAGG